MVECLGQHNGVVSISYAGVVGAKLRAAASRKARLLYPDCRVWVAQTYLAHMIYDDQTEMETDDVVALLVSNAQYEDVVMRSLLAAGRGATRVVFPPSQHSLGRRWAEWQHQAAQE